jgi:hypothetical protein
VLVAFAVAALLAGVPAARAGTGATDTWTGQGAVPGNWSDPANWDGGTPTNGAALSFGMFACQSWMACDTTTDDIGSLTASNLSIADNLQYSLAGSGTALTLDPSTGDGLDAAPVTSSTGSAPGSPVIAVPLILGDAQSWSVEGNGLGSGAVSVGALSGAPNPLAVTLADGGQLYLDGTVDTGPLTVRDDPTQGSGTGGELGLFGNVDSAPSDGGIDVDDVGLQLGDFSGRQATTGSLMVSDSAVTLGTSGPGGPGSTLVDGTFSVDPQSAMTVALEGTGANGGTDYAQLVATGNVTLAGSLALLDEGASSTVCPTATAGSSDTFIETTGGTLTGTFDNLPEGALTSITAHCNGGTERYPIRIDYTPTAVTGTFVSPSATSTTVSAAPAAITSGGSVTLTATVAPAGSGAGTPSGAVQFLDGTTPITCTGSGDGALRGGAPDTATCTTTGLPVGSDPLTAAYGGDGGFEASSSAAVTVVVSGAGPGGSGTASPPPGSGSSGGPTTSGGSTTAGGSGSGTSGSSAGAGGSAGSGGSATTGGTGAGDSGGAAGTGSPRIAGAAVTSGRGGVQVGVSCARGGASCAVVLRLITRERVRRRGHLSHRVIVLGRTTTTLGAGDDRVSAVTLDATGRRMLARDRVLRARLVLQRSVAGHLRTLSARRVTLHAGKFTSPPGVGLK